MTFPGSASATATFGDYADIAALHGATKASVDAVTAKLEAIRNDNTAAAVTQSGTWQVNLGTLNGAATETTLGALNTKTATLGRKVSTGSAPVVLASDHANVPTAPDGVADAAKTPSWDGAALPTDGYGAAVLTISAIAGGASITVTGNGGGTTDHSLAIINLATHAIVSAITTVGVYQVTAAGSLKYAKAGGTGTATVNVLLKR